MMKWLGRFIWVALIATITACANMNYTAPPLVGERLRSAEAVRSSDLPASVAVVDILLRQMGDIEICVNDQRIGPVGTGRIVAVVPLGRMYISWPNEYLMTPCNEKSLLFPDRYSGNVSAYYLDVNESGAYLWDVSENRFLKKPRWLDSQVADFPIIALYVSPKVDVNQLVQDRTDKDQPFMPLDRAKALCSEIGLQAGNEEFGNCVIRLLK